MVDDEKGQNTTTFSKINKKDTNNKKIATQQPEPDHAFRDGLSSGLLCSDEKVKTLDIKLLEYTTAKIEPYNGCMTIIRFKNGSMAAFVSKNIGADNKERAK